MPKRKYYLTDKSGKTKIFSSFNQLLRALKLKEEEELKLAEVLGKVAFTQDEEVFYKNEELKITIDYK